MALNVIHNINFAAGSVLQNTFALNGLSSMYADVSNHGCWCAKINSANDKNILGGPDPQDGLDEICRQWFQCRHCNDQIREGSCYKLENVAQVSYDMNSANGALECVVSSDNCGNDSCSIDKYYSNLIVDYMNSQVFSLIQVSDRSECYPTGNPRANVAASSSNAASAQAALSQAANLSNQVCQGSAPYLNVVKRTRATSASLTDNYKISFDFTLLKDDGWPIKANDNPTTIIRVLNKAGGATNDDFTRYPVIFYYKEDKKIVVAAASCDANDWSQQQYFYAGPAMEKDETYYVVVERSGHTISLGVNGVFTTMNLASLDRVCRDGREVEMKLFNNFGFTDPHEYTAEEWAKVDNLHFEELSPIKTFDLAESETTTCGAQGQGICILVETSTAASAGSASQFGVTVKTTGQKETSFKLQGKSSGEIVKLCDCRLPSTFEQGETIESVDVECVSGTDGWKVKKLQVDINPGTAFASDPAVLTSNATEWRMDASNLFGFWLDADYPGHVDAEGSPTCADIDGKCPLSQPSS